MKGFVFIRSWHVLHTMISHQLLVLILFLQGLSSFLWAELLQEFRFHQIFNQEPTEEMWQSNLAWLLLLESFNIFNSWSAWPSFYLLFFFFLVKIRNNYQQNLRKMLWKEFHAMLHRMYHSKSRTQLHASDIVMRVFNHYWKDGITAKTRVLFHLTMLLKKNKI